MDSDYNNNIIAEIILGNYEFSVSLNLPRNNKILPLILYIHTMS